MLFGNKPTIILLLFFSLILPGCEKMDDKKNPEQSTVPEKSAAEETVSTSNKNEGTPPQPPLKETFDGTPRISLFPRVGDYQPDRSEERYPFWKTFIDHFTKVSGLSENPETKNKFWSFRGIKSLDSVAFFTPIGVEPDTAYRISYMVKADLPVNSKTGIGVLEFSKFLWIGEQYSEKTSEEFQLSSQIGVDISESIDWATKEFILVTGPKTRMIHLVFYREGEHSRNPVLIDDIEITKAEDKI